ncbi:MAG: hypothetical protein EBQ97_06415, partial [Bacteroidetes bacterium]|nr:hypothetical protein [Bacteroidota bacterium]
RDAFGGAVFHHSGFKKIHRFMPEIPCNTSAIGLGPLVHSENGHIHKIQPAQSQLNEDPKNPKGAVGIAFLHDLGFVKGLFRIR